MIDPIAAALIFGAIVCREGELCNRHPAGREFHFGVFAQITDQDHFIYALCHGVLLRRLWPGIVTRDCYPRFDQRPGAYFGRTAHIRRGPEPEYNRIGAVEFPGGPRRQTTDTA